MQIGLGLWLGTRQVGDGSSLNLNFLSGSLDSRIDFTRTSAGTFVGSNGLIQNTPASVNLLTWTQEFDNAAWTKLSTTVTANSTVAPDGTPTADKLAEDATNNQHRANATYTFPNTNPHTLSVYAKAAERSWVRVNNGSDNLGAFFNLADGTVGTVTAGTTASITAVGDGWYRCAVTFSPLTAAAKSIAFNISTDGATTTYTGNGTSGIFLWGAQLETGSTATTYTRNVGGLFPARFDYDPVTLAPRGILIEEQRTNLLTYSEQFDNAAWTKSATGTAIAPVVTANAAISPDGTMDADLVVFDRGAGTDRSDLKQTPSLSAGTYTQSVWLKAATPSDVGKQLALRNVAGTTFSVVTLTADWVRYTRTEVWVSNNWEITNRSGVTADITVSAHIWGAQLEAGAFATSYIPTVASQVTRTADQASIVAPMFAPWYNQTEGTFVVEATTTGDILASYSMVALNSAVTSLVGFDIDASGAYRLRVTNSGANQALINAVNPAVANTTYKMAGAYKDNDFAVSANGGAVGTDTSGTVPSDMVGLAIGSGSFAGAISWNGHIRSIKYFPVRLLDTQLQALTA